MLSNLAEVSAVSALLLAGWRRSDFRGSFFGAGGLVANGPVFPGSVDFAREPFFRKGLLEGAPLVAAASSGNAVEASDTPDGGGAL
mmetsp:Transcript_32922/g.73915  ORF Transcript_32922/g.73915 Transcript_32922/m.73915 type:complete len:86 (+) Transcript_32922:1734-1991(+)